MEKLTLEKIAPFLPYGLKAVTIPTYIIEIYGLDCSEDCILNKFGDRTFPLTVIKPILYPMDLTKPIMVDGKEIVPVVELLKPMFNLDASKLNEVMNSILYEDRILLHYDNLNLSISQWQWLFKHKFDVFGLIPLGLAIDVNTLEINPYN